MAQILKGKPVVDALKRRMLREEEELAKKGITPAMAILRTGDSDDDKYYERNVMIQCRGTGVEVRNVILPGDIDNESFFNELEKLNNDAEIHGVLMLMPLPEQIDEERVRRKLAPAKDIDGCTRASMAGVYSDTDIGFAPCTAQAAMEILRYYNVSLAGKKTVVLGRSLVAGKPLAMMLLQENATVTICHSKTPDARTITAEADIVIAAVGRAEGIGPEYFSAGQTVIDIGINWSNEKNKICGDVDFDKVKDIVGAITPAPGGVGSVTTKVLINHVIEAAMKAKI